MVRKTFGTVDVLRGNQLPGPGLRGSASYKGQLFLEEGSGNYYKALAAGPDVAFERVILASEDQLNATFVGVVATGVVTRNPDGSIATTVEDGVTHTYGRDANGQIITDTTTDRIVTYTRDASGISGWTTEVL